MTFALFGLSALRTIVFYCQRLRASSSAEDLVRA